MDDLTVEQIIAFHARVMMADGGDDRLLSEANLHQVVFLANRVDDSYQRSALVFFSLVAYPAFREGNSRTARLMIDMIFLENGYALKDADEGIAGLVQGIKLFTVEQADVEEWMRTHAKKLAV
jgi:prophage maintenance system killer protein